MNPTKTEAIKSFLQCSTHIDLAELYNFNMECQVNVAQDGGTRVEDDYKGRHWHGYTDGITTWKSFRIPYKASTEPEYTDTKITWDLAQHAIGIGMTGWDWKNKVSKWVAFDFDAIIGHNEKHGNKLTPQELKQVMDAAYNIDYITIRRSTSGSGLHLYIFLEDVPTQNHTEHAALARSILGQLSATTGFDFNSKVDICGGNMWVWHRKMAGTNGLTLLKSGSVLTEIPPNWQDHINVIKGKRTKNKPHNIENINVLEELCGQRANIPLDETHKLLINYLQENDCMWWWDQDYHMLVTHTYYLKKAHEALNFKGVFDTNSAGSEAPADHNCFLFPMRYGAWSVRRYSQGVSEHESWSQDNSGWTRTYLNRDPDLYTVARVYGALEDPSGGFVFSEAEIAKQAAQQLGVSIDLDPSIARRKTTLKQHKDGRLVVAVDYSEVDNPDHLHGWLKKQKQWVKVTNKVITTHDEPEIGNYDDLIRHVVTELGEDYGWIMYTDNQWRVEPLTHIKIALGALGLSPKEITSALGSSIFKCWKLVNKPFQSEFPGDRQWNRNAAQLRFAPSQDQDNLHYPTWSKILNHCGQSLDDAVKDCDILKSHNILTGADYLKCWMASIIQLPFEPLPYLFMYGPQNSGKSIFHEAFSLLLTNGYRIANDALKNQSGFNGELEGAIICVVEEIDLTHNKNAYDLIKNWVTATEISIHHKQRTPFHVPNTTHWVQCSNNPNSCPVFPGDTRITMIFVNDLEQDQLIPKRRMLQQLEKEAPDFLASLQNLTLPESNDRLNIPVLLTQDKAELQAYNQDEVAQFVESKCKRANGYMIKYSDFCDKFFEVHCMDMGKWTKQKIGRLIPMWVKKGRSRKYTNQVYLCNIAWNEEDTSEQRPELDVHFENIYEKPSK